MENDNSPTVTVKQGTLKGKVKKTFSGSKYESFTGIPYAKPPLGKLRFKDPEPAEPWKGVYDATKEAKACSQIDDMITQKYIGEEDCLYLNVHTPKRGKRALPVLFWIHGGGYVAGYGNESVYGPDFFMDKEVVIVTVNYRLGALGFLCLHTAAVPGNAGLKDQLMALKWVNENIAEFGGDPKNITIFGESAGSACVDMFIVSPQAKGLFQKAIGQSGCCLNPWAVQQRPVEMAFRLGKMLNFETDDIQKLYDFLQTVSAEDLANAMKSPLWADVLNIPCAPVVEKTPSGFLTEDPVKILSSGRHNICPTISGFNSNEGVMLFMMFLKGSGKKFEKLQDIIPDIKYLVPGGTARKLNAEDLQKTAEEINKLYFLSREDVPDWQKYMDYVSDMLFLSGIKAKNDILKKYSDKVYSYKFAYNGDINLTKALFGSLIKEQGISGLYEGAAHSDELTYLFKPVMIEDIRVQDLKMTETMTVMWTNFAKYGEPTIRETPKTPVLWHPMTKSSLDCLLIDKEMKMLSNPYGDKVDYWNKHN